MKNLRPEKENIIKNIRNLFRLEKETKGIKDEILMDNKNLFEEYYKPIKVNNIWSNNYIEYKSNGDRYQTLSVEEYLDKIRPYLKDIINDLKKSDAWKIQLMTTVNFISSNDDNDEQRVMHSKGNNIEIMISDEVDELIEELFDSSENRYQNNLETKMIGSQCGFDYVHLLYHKCQKNIIQIGQKFLSIHA